MKVNYVSVGQHFAIPYSDPESTPMGLFQIYNILKILSDFA